MDGPLSTSATVALQPFCESDPIVRRRVELPRSGGFDVAVSQIEPAGRGVIGSGRCLNYHQSGVQTLEPSFNLVQEDGSATCPLPGGIDRDPVEIPGAIGRRCRTVAGKAGQLVFRGEGAEEGIVGADWRSDRVRGNCIMRARRRVERRIEKLERDFHFLLSEELAGAEDPADAVAMARRKRADSDYGVQLVPERRSARGQSSATLIAG